MKDSSSIMLTGSSSDDSDSSDDPNYYARPLSVPFRNHPKRIQKRAENQGEVRSSSSIQQASKKTRREIVEPLLFWLLEKIYISEYEKVVCGDKEGSIRRGDKERHNKRGGIFCYCCSEVYTTQGFVLHSKVDTNRPYESIFIGKYKFPTSLLMYLENACILTGMFENDDPVRIGAIKDDVCVLCNDGGDLICCERCPSTYHWQCMGYKDVPSQNWYCPYCTCKFCKTPCDDNAPSCAQCNKTYHTQCYKAIFQVDVSPSCVSFCDNNCKEVKEKLGSLVGVQQELSEGLTWTLLQLGLFPSDRYQRTVCHAKLAMARELLGECFEDIQDRFTKIDFIENVIYSRSYIRLNFGRFYTAILEKDSEIVSAAAVRIHGRNLAEIPFIATSKKFRRQGMCKMLMTSIELALSNLNTQILVLPMIEDTEELASKFDFHPGDDFLTKELRMWNTLILPRSKVFYKTLPTSQAGGVEMAASSNMSRLLVDVNQVRRDVEVEIGDCSKNNIQRVVPDLNEDPPEDPDEDINKNYQIL